MSPSEASERKKHFKGIQYDRYFASNDPEQIDKCYNRIIKLPRPKEPLPLYLKHIKEDLRKKYKEVFSDEDTDSEKELDE